MATKAAKTVAVGTAPVQVLAANANRQLAQFRLRGTGQLVRIGQDAAAAEQGLTFRYEDGVYPDDIPSTDAWWMVCPGGNAEVEVLEYSG
jgi:hypothetical protein